MLQNLFFLTNNIIVNNILIWLRLDGKMQLATRQWKVSKYNKSKTIQENAGFSHRQEIEDALRKIKEDIAAVIKKYISEKF